MRFFSSYKQGLDRLYVDCELKKNLQNSYCMYLSLWVIVKTREDPSNGTGTLLIWKTLEQVAIFFDVCGEFYHAYCELRQSNKMRENQGLDYTSHLYKNELARMLWGDFPVVNECDLDSLFDSIRDMLSYRVFYLHNMHNLLLILQETCIEINY